MRYNGIPDWCETQDKTHLEDTAATNLGAVKCYTDDPISSDYIRSACAKQSAPIFRVPSASGAHCFGWDLYVATAINDAGQIIGTGLYNSNTRAFLLTPERGCDVVSAEQLRWHLLSHAQRGNYVANPILSDASNLQELIDASVFQWPVVQNAKTAISPDKCLIYACSWMPLAHDLP